MASHRLPQPTVSPGQSQFSSTALRRRCSPPGLTPLVYEGLRLRFQTGNRERIYAALAGGHAELAITASLPDETIHGFAELGRERLLLIASPDMTARTTARTVSAELLSTIPAIAYDEGLPLLREFFQEVFASTPDLQAAITAPDLRIVMETVRAGAGWSVLPDYLCSDDLTRGTLMEIPTAKPGPDNLLYLVWNKGSLRHPRVTYVRDFLLRRPFREA